jgi:hypothetical protein
MLLSSNGFVEAAVDWAASIEKAPDAKNYFSSRECNMLSPSKLYYSCSNSIMRKPIYDESIQTTFLFHHAQTIHMTVTTNEVVRSIHMLSSKPEKSVQEHEKSHAGCCFLVQTVCISSS